MFRRIWRGPWRGTVRRLWDREDARSRLSSILRSWTLLLLCLAGLSTFLWVVNDHYPVKKWLFWTYAEIWVLTLYVGVACLSVGDVIVVRLIRYRSSLRERWLLAFAVGLLVFCLGVFLFGLFGALGTPFFVLWPAVLAATGASPLWSTVRRTVRRLSIVSPVGPPRSLLAVWLGRLTLLFGVGMATLLYINILSPGNVAYDSRWYHLAIAEHYAAAGGVHRFPEGWFCGTYPHLASYLYTWAFLYPASNLFQRIELAAHLEFLVFVATLAGIGVLVRWCVRDVRVKNAWAATFLFSGILLYDSSLSVAADHVLAFWAVPIFLALRRVYRTFDVPAAVVLGVCAAAAVMTKYQAVYFLAIVALALVWAVVMRLVGPNRRVGEGIVGGRDHALGAVAVCAGAALIASTPLWLKNWIWYGDPVYPLLPKLFTPRPFVFGTDPNKLLQVTTWSVQGTLAEKIRETFKATFTFSFVPHDWPNLHGFVPVFGSLFTLCLPLLLFIRPRARVAAVAFATWIGVAIWFWTYHQDRYLQALVPWMATVVAAVFVLAWRAGWAARVGVAVLAMTQIIWGGDVYTFPTHAMLRQAAPKAAIDLVSSGFRQDWAARSESYQEMGPVARQLPPRSKVLIHERLVHLGVGTPSVADMAGTQGGISYMALRSPRAIHDLYRQFGVTHVLWWPGNTETVHTLAENLVFFEYAEKYTTDRVPAAGYTLAKIPVKAPPMPPAGAAAVRWVRIVGCGEEALVPLQHVDAAVNSKMPIRFTAPPGTQPDFVVTRPNCDESPPTAIDGFFPIPETHAGSSLWIRS